MSVRGAYAGPDSDTTTDDDLLSKRQQQQDTVSSRPVVVIGNTSQCWPWDVSMIENPTDHEQARNLNTQQRAPSSSVVTLEFSSVAWQGHHP